MNSNPSPDAYCETCTALAKELRDGFVILQKRFRESWLASGRTHQDFVKALKDLMDGSVSVGSPEYVQQFREFAAAERRRREHEAASGHSILKALGPADLPLQGGLN
jgi:hypothetical protein